MKTILNLHGLIPSSRVNGPGSRCVVFFQGCARGCPGCFNPATHGFAINKTITVKEALSKVPSHAEGLTISGGEPFSQPLGLGALLLSMRKMDKKLSAIVYTGFTMDELLADDEKAALVPLIDVIVAGPYEAMRPEKTLLARGSTNQSFHLISPRYSIDDLYLPGRIEVTIGLDGSLTGTGFARLLPAGIHR